MDFIDTFDPITKDVDMFNHDFVSDIVKQTMVDIGDLKASLCLWDEEERKTSDCSEDVLKLLPVTRGKAEVYLDMFFKMQLWSTKSLKEPQQELFPRHNMTPILNRNLIESDNDRRSSPALSTKLKNNSPFTPDITVSPGLMDSLTPVESKSPGSFPLSSDIRVKMAPTDLSSPKVDLEPRECGFPHTQKPEEKPSDQKLRIPKDILSTDFTPSPEMCEVTVFPVSSPSIPVEVIKMGEMLPQSFGNTPSDLAATTEMETNTKRSKHLPPSNRVSRYSTTPDMTVMNMDLTDSPSPANSALTEATLNSIPPAAVNEELVQYTQHLVQCFKILENQDNDRRKRSISEKRSFSNCSARLEERRQSPCCASFLQICTRASAPELAYEYSHTLDETETLTPTKTDFKGTSKSPPVVSAENKDKGDTLIDVTRSSSHSRPKSGVEGEMASPAFSSPSTMEPSNPGMMDFSQVLDETLAVSTLTSEKISFSNCSKSELTESCINALYDQFDSDNQNLMSETRLSSRSEVRTSALFSSPACRAVSAPELTVSFSITFEETRTLSSAQQSENKADNEDKDNITNEKRTETCSPNLTLSAHSTVSLQEEVVSHTVEDTSGFSPVVSEKDKYDGQNVLVPDALMSLRCPSGLQKNTDTALPVLRTQYGSTEVLKESWGSSSALPEDEDTQKSNWVFSVEDGPDGIKTNPSSNCSSRSAKRRKTTSSAFPSSSSCTGAFTPEMPRSSPQGVRDILGQSSTSKVHSDKDTTTPDKIASTSFSTKSKVNTKIDSSIFSSFPTTAALTEAILCTFPVVVVDEELKKYTENLVKCFKMLESQEDFKDRKSVIITDAKSSVTCSGRAGRRASSSVSRSRPSLRKTTSLSLSTPELAARCYQVCSESPGVPSAISEETCNQPTIKLKEEKYFREMIDTETRSSSTISALQCKRAAHFSSSPLCASTPALSAMKVEEEDEELSQNRMTSGASTNWSTPSFSPGLKVPTPEIEDIYAQTYRNSLPPVISKNEEAYSLSPRLSSSSSTRPEVGSTIASSSPIATAQSIPDITREYSQVFDEYDGHSLTISENEESSFSYQTKPGIEQQEGSREDLKGPTGRSSTRLSVQQATDTPIPARMGGCFDASDESMMEIEESKNKIISDQQLRSKSSAGYHLSGMDESSNLTPTQDLVRRSTPSFQISPALSKAKADSLAMAEVQPGHWVDSDSISHFKAKTENIKMDRVSQVKMGSVTTPNKESFHVSPTMSKNVNIFQTNPNNEETSIIPKVKSERKIYVIPQPLSRKEQHKLYNAKSKMDDTRPSSNCSVMSDVGMTTSSSDSDPSPSTSTITEAILSSVPLAAVDEELKRYTHRLVHCFTMLEKQGESKDGNSGVTTKSRSSSKNSSGSSGLNTKAILEKTQVCPAQLTLATYHTSQQQTNGIKTGHTVSRMCFNGGQFNTIKPLSQKDLKQDRQFPAASTSTKEGSDPSSDESVKSQKEESNKKSLWSRFTSSRCSNKTHPLPERNHKLGSCPTQSSTAEHSHVKCKIDKLPMLENKKTLSCGSRDALATWKKQLFLPAQDCQTMVSAPAEILTRTDLRFQQKTSDLPKHNKDKNSAWWTFCFARRRNKIHPLPEEL